jgi:hypothetical protein
MENVNLLEKWQKILDMPNCPKITDNYKRRTTAILLENTLKSISEKNASMQMLTEAPPANVTGDIDRFDPVLIKLVRRTVPNLVAHDICGVQPMTMPTGLIFALRRRYATTSPLSGAPEAGYNEADTDYSGTGTHQPDNITGTFGTGMDTATGEGVVPAKMGFTIEKVSVTAKTRALQAEYSVELAQDLKNVHNLDAESELIDILNIEITAEINREIVRTIYKIAEAGAQVGTSTPGTFDVDVDSDGRWSVEKFKGILYQIEREANAIAKRTRMGKGNFVIVSSDVASALAMAGKLDYAPALSTDLEVDDTGNTFAGVLNNRIKVFIDPYFYSTSAEDILVVGYKGKSPYDAGLFYAPYVPLTLYKAQDPTTFQPKLMFKTRYGMVSNPLNGDGTVLAANSNKYYRRVLIKNIM